MLRKLIAIILGLAVAITGFVTPAYAYSANSGIVFDNHQENYSTGYDGYGYSGRTTEDWSEKFGNSIVDGVVTTTGVAIGGVVVCYTLDGIATMFFPPAAALAAFCPSAGAAAVGANAFVQAAK